MEVQWYQCWRFYVLALGKGLKITKKGVSNPIAAAIRGRDEVVGLQIERGANLHVKDNNGQTPVDIA